MSCRQHRLQLEATHRSSGCCLQVNNTHTRYSRPCRCTNTTVTDKLQRVLKSVLLRVITGTRKFDRGLGQILHDHLSMRSTISTFSIGFSSSWQWQFTSVWTAAYHCICRPLHPGLQCWHAAASALRQPSPACRTAFPAQHLRPSDFALTVQAFEIISDTLVYKPTAMLYSDCLVTKGTFESIYICLKRKWSNAC